VNDDMVCDRLQRELSALRQSWQKIQRQLKRRVIFGTIDVIRSWNSAQVRTISLSLSSSFAYLNSVPIRTSIYKVGALL